MNNSSFGNSTQTPEVSENILIIFLDSLILLLSLSGNSLVIYTIRKEHKLQTTCNYLLLNLALCDIIVVTIGASVDIMLQFTKSKWILGSVLCHVINPALTMFYISASLILVVISIDRYKMFVHPLKARYQRKHVKYAIFIVHSISLSCVLPFGYFSTITDGYCYDSWPQIWYRKAYTVFLFIMQYALPLTIMAFAYIGVAVSLLRNKAAFKRKFEIIESQNSTPPQSLGRMKSEMYDGINLTEVSVNTMASSPLKNNREQSHLAKSMAVILENNGQVKNILKKDLNAYNSGGVMSTSTNQTQMKSCFGSCIKSVKVSDHKLLFHKPYEENERQRTQVKLSQNDNSRTETHKTSLSNAKKHAPFGRSATHRRGRTSTHAGMPPKRDQRSNRALKMILLVVVVFAVFMLPMQIMSLLLDFGGKPTSEKYKIYAWFVMCSYFGSCTLNPFIYGLVDRTFRAGFKKFGRKIACLWKCWSN